MRRFLGLQQAFGSWVTTVFASSLEVVIGEATKRLSDNFRADYPDIPCRSMAGMRDIVIRAYDHIDLSEVWYTVTLALPDLITKIEPSIPPEQNG